MLRPMNNGNSAFRVKCVPRKSAKQSHPTLTAPVGQSRSQFRYPSLRPTPRSPSVHAITRPAPHCRAELQLHRRILLQVRHERLEERLAGVAHELEHGALCRGDDEWQPLPSLHRRLLVQRPHAGDGVERQVHCVLNVGEAQQVERSLHNAHVRLDAVQEDVRTTAVLLAHLLQHRGREHGEERLGVQRVLDGVELELGDGGLERLLLRYDDGNVQLVGDLCEERGGGDE